MNYYVCQNKYRYSNRTRPYFLPTQRQRENSSLAMQDYYQPKKAQLPHIVRTLQDGESPYSEIPSPKGRLDDQGRLERCLLYGTNSKTIPPSSPLQGPISVSPLRVMQHHKGVHKSPQTSSWAAEVLRHKVSDLHGQHVTDGQLKATNSRADLHSSVSPGICHQKQKICANCLPANGVSWDDGGLTVHGITQALELLQLAIRLISGWSDVQ